MSGQDDYTYFIGNDTAASANTSDITWGTITISGSGEPERDENMRCLFRITVVNPKMEIVYESLLVIAKDRETALLRVDLPSGVRTNPDDYDILVEHVGDVRAKEEVKKVKVVTED